MSDANSNNNTGNTNQRVHIVLLGDSIFDNEVYVRGGKSVIAHLKEKIPSEWQATLCAVDGNVISHISRQLKNVPADATHLFVSIGGNNALGVQHKVQDSVRNVGEGLLKLHAIQKEFQKEYHGMLKGVLALSLPTTLCNIYNPNFGDNPQQYVAETGLCALNDVIVNAATTHNLPLINIKTMFNDPRDYANPIEPSEQGGKKLAEAIIRVVKQHNFGVSPAIYT